MNRGLAIALTATLCSSCQNAEKSASDALYEQALGLMHQNRFATAEPLLYRVLELAPDSTIASIRLGESQNLP